MWPWLLWRHRTCHSVIYKSIAKVIFKPKKVTYQIYSKNEHYQKCFIVLLFLPSSQCQYSQLQKRDPSSLKKVCVFQKILSRLKYWKSSKFPVTVTWKHTDLSNGGLFWKSLALIFRKTYALSVGFKMKPVRKSVFLC